MITFKSFLLEADKDEPWHLGLSDEDIAEIIKRDCDPWLKQAGKHQVFRGMSVGRSDGFVKYVNNFSTDLAIGTVRNDRRPSASPMWLHDAMNEYFKSEIGIPLRSASLFTAGSPSIAQDYAGGSGHAVYSIFPVGDFNYAWSPLVYDPTYEFYSTVSQAEGFKPFDEKLKVKFDAFWKKNYKTIPETRHYPTMLEYCAAWSFKIAVGTQAPGGYEKMVAKFIMEENLWKFNTGLTEAITKYPRNEVMITCNKYYAVPISVAARVNNLL